MACYPWLTSLLFKITDSIRGANWWMLSWEWLTWWECFIITWFNRSLYHHRNCPESQRRISNNFYYALSIIALITLLAHYKTCIQYKRYKSFPLWSTAVWSGQEIYACKIYIYAFMIICTASYIRQEESCWWLLQRLIRAYFARHKCIYGSASNVNEELITVVGVGHTEYYLDI